VDFSSALSGAIAFEKLRARRDSECESPLLATTRTFAPVPARIGFIALSPLRRVLVVLLFLPGGRGEGGEPAANVVRRRGGGEAGETPAAILHRVHEHILVAFALQVCCPTYRAPFLLLPVFFSSSGVICGSVIIHGFDGIFFPESPLVNDFFVVHSNDIAPTFFC
jgi:hypothetical protein